MAERTEASLLVVLNTRGGWGFVPVLIAAVTLCLAAGCGTPLPDENDTQAIQHDLGGTGDVLVELDTAPASYPLREPGQREPRTGTCDPADPQLCLLPWPSNVFTRIDDTTATGIRLAVDGASLPDDDPTTLLESSDGFSRLSPLLTGFERDLDPTSLEGASPHDTPMRVFVAEGDNLGTLESVHCVVLTDEFAPHRSVLTCYPRRPLAPATEHLAVLMKSVRTADGVSVGTDRHTLVSLGLEAPANDEEARLYAYHAPARQTLEKAGIAPDDISRLWDFTTRSFDNPQEGLRAVRQANLDAVSNEVVGIELDQVKLSNKESTGLIVTGRLTGLPSFLPKDEGGLMQDDAGQYVPVGTRDALFRAVLPTGEGDYKVVIFGHGTGGDVSDSSFDTLMTDKGAMKLGLEFDGWTEMTLGSTLVGLATPLKGGDRTAARIVESLAGSSAILAALDGILGDLLSADTIGGLPNPAAGRRPDASDPVWAGGSLGGIMGLIFSHLEPSIIGGVLNVPGSGFSHWLPASELYTVLKLALEDRYEGAQGLSLIMAMAQTLFDPMDGAVWVEPSDRVFLVQMSMGDPVVPNVGSNLVATSLDAAQLGVPLEPIVGLEVVDKAVGISAVTQFRVAADTPYGIHGFTATNTVSGHAAQQQFIDFVATLWAGEPVIEVPTACQNNTPPNSCDFKGDTP
jgi:hypothetical protein